MGWKPRRTGRVHAAAGYSALAAGMKALEQWYGAI